MSTTFPHISPFDPNDDKPKVYTVVACDADGKPITRAMVWRLYDWSGYPKTQEAFHAYILASDDPSELAGWTSLLIQLKGDRTYAARPEIAQTVEAFRATMSRLKSLCVMPDTVWSHARLHERYRAIAFFQDYGRPYETLEDTDLAMEQLATRVHEWLSGRSQHDPRHNSFIIQLNGEFLSNNAVPKRYRESCLAILESVVIGAFSALETLSADLWEDMTNARPRSALKAFTSKDAKTQEKQIDLSCLNDYDLSKQMGRMLRDKKKVEFASLRSTQNAHVRTFGYSAKASLDRPGVYVLEEVRNLLAHRRGVIDAEFLNGIENILKQNKRFTHPFGKLSEGSRIRLNGKIAAELLVDVFAAAADLTQFSVNWLSSHPT